MKQAHVLLVQAEEVCGTVVQGMEQTAFRNDLVERHNQTVNEMLCVTTGKHPITWDQFF